MSRVIKAPPIDKSPFQVGQRTRRPADKDDVLVSSDPGEVLRHAEDKARGILAQAQKEKAALIEQARAECAAIRESARLEGLEEGQTKARESLRAEVETQLEQLAAFMAAAQDETIDMVRKNEKALVALAIEIAAKILKDRIESDHEIVVRNAQDAIARAVQKESLVIRVNPRDLLTLRRFQEEFMVSFDAIREIRIEEDNRVGCGGCIVETGSGNVEARIDKQLEEVKRALLL